MRSSPSSASSSSTSSALTVDAAWSPGGLLRRGSAMRGPSSTSGTTTASADTTFVALAFGMPVGTGATPVLTGPATGGTAFGASPPTSVRVPFAAAATLSSRSLLDLSALSNCWPLSLRSPSDRRADAVSPLSRRPTTMSPSPILMALAMTPPVFFENRPTPPARSKMLIRVSNTSDTTPTAQNTRKVPGPDRRLDETSPMREPSFPPGACSSSRMGVAMTWARTVSETSPQSAPSTSSRCIRPRRPTR